MTDPKSKIAGMVEIDINALDKDELIMLGMKIALREFVDRFRAHAADVQHKGVAQVMRECANWMEYDEDKIKVELSARAIRRKAGTLQEIRAH
jgi:ribosomal protein L28